MACDRHNRTLVESMLNLSSAVEQMSGCYAKKAWIITIIYLDSYITSMVYSLYDDNLRGVGRPDAQTHIGTAPRTPPDGR